MQQGVRHLPDDCEGLSAEAIQSLYGVDKEMMMQNGDPEDGESSDEEGSGSDSGSEWSRIHSDVHSDDMTSSGSEWEAIATGNDQEKEGDTNSSADSIYDEAEPGFMHEPVAVPSSDSPFIQADLLEALKAAVERARQGEGENPTGYGVCPEEWDTDGYPASEVLKSGRRAGHELGIPLPSDLWLPRAELWAKSLFFLHRLQHVEQSHGSPDT